MADNLLSMIYDDLNQNISRTKQHAFLLLKQKFLLAFHIQGRSKLDNLGGGGGGG